MLMVMMDNEELHGARLDGGGLVGAMIGHGFGACNDETSNAIALAASIPYLSHI